MWIPLLPLREVWGGLLDGLQDADLHGRELVFGPSGVRAQALAADGRLVDDFVVHQARRAVHVRNAARRLPPLRWPSPS